MSQRNIRVNELIKREIGEVLHTRYQAEMVRVTVTRVDVAPDHRKAHVFFSVIGGEEHARPALRWLTKNQREIRRHVGRNITLKFLPHLQFHYDPSIAEGDRVLEILQDLDEPMDEPEA
jgi:ribosome-binding factor A